MKKVRMGRMKHNATVITLGGCGLGRMRQDEADEALKLPLEYGVNVIDVAPTYGDAELRLAPLMKENRDKFFLAEKTRERSRELAWREMHESLWRLGVENFDLYQMHALGSMSELDQAFRKGGAIEAFEEAQQTGLTKYIGVTGHEDMRVLKEALVLHEFDSVLLPVSLCSMAKPHFQNDYRPVLKEAIDRGVSVTAIKAISRGRWYGMRKYRTWYEPLDTLEEIKMGVRFTLSQEGVVTYSLPCDVKLWEMVLEVAEDFEPMSEVEQNEAMDYGRKQGFSPLFP